MWLAHPFSARAEPFRVGTGDKKWDAICVWDALGILVLTDSDGIVTTACPDCQEPLTIEVKGGAISPKEYVVHFGVPARSWYDDIAYT
ncbi:MAG: organomercurial lyase [Actinomycetota bacterium]